MNGWLQPVLELLATLVAPLCVVFAARKAAGRRENRLRSGRTVAWSCRAQRGQGPLCRGKLVAPGLGEPLTFVPRRGKPGDVPTGGVVTGTREEPVGTWDNPHTGATSLFYRSASQETFRFRLRSTDVPTVRRALESARARPGVHLVKPWGVAAPIPLRRWWLTALAGALLVGAGCGLSALADWRSHDVVVNVLSTDGHEHCVVSWPDPWTHQRRQAPMECPDDEWVGGPLRPGDRADAEVAGWPFHGNVHPYSREENDPVFSTGIWAVVIGLPVTAFGLLAALVVMVRRLLTIWCGAARGRVQRRSPPSGLRAATGVSRARRARPAPGGSPAGRSGSPPAGGSG